MSDSGDELTYEEKWAIASLQRIAKRWPQSLTLLVSDFDLVIIRSGEPGMDLDLNKQEVLASIKGIPNNAGDQRY